MIVLRPLIWIATTFYCAALGLLWCGRRYGWDTFTAAAVTITGLTYAVFSVGG